MKNDVLDVSRYAINYSNEKEWGLSNLKLQKILYFIQAFFLVVKDEVCFTDPIEAWDFGPVVRRAYTEFRQYGGMNIPSIKSYLITNEKNIWDIQRVTFNKNIIDKDDRRLIRDVVDRFSDYSASDLVYLTHDQAPWKDAYVPGMSNEITVEAIKNYFVD